MSDGFNDSRIHVESRFYQIFSVTGRTSSYYHDNNGNPIKTVENGLQKLYEECRRRGTTLRIKGGCSTGYGEDLIKAAFHMER